MLLIIIAEASAHLWSQFQHVLLLGLRRISQVGWVVHHRIEEDVIPMHHRSLTHVSVLRQLNHLKG